MVKVKEMMIILFLLILIGIVMISLMFFYTHINKESVSIINIKLNNVTLGEINSGSKEIKYLDNIIELDMGKSKVMYDNVTIKGRGNFSWTVLKKSYQIKFDKEVNLFDLGKAEKWVLLANYTDESLIRNHMAFYLGKTIGMGYTNNGINVDLYIDGEYMGVYYLTPKIAINSASVNLKNSDAIIVELDNNYYFLEDKYYVSNYYNDHFIVKDIGDKEEENMTEFMNKYNRFENSIIDVDWNSILKLIDVESFAKYYIINNFVINNDAYRSSFYMYIDGKNDKIHAGPIWDFDLAFENHISKKSYIVDESKFNFYDNIPNDRTFAKESQIIYKLLSFKEFQNIIKDIWNNKMKDTLEDTLSEVDRQYNIVKDSAEKNIEKWNYPNTYKEYIDELKDIIKNLYERFDTKIKNNNFY